MGWPLFVALFIGMVFGVSLGVLEYFKRMNQKTVSAPATAMQKKIALQACMVWIGVAALAGFPIVSFMLRSGGHSVFGV